MNTRQIVSHKGYRVMVVNNLWFLIDPEGKLIYWTTHGPGTMQEQALLYQVMEKVAEMHRDVGKIVRAFIWEGNLAWGWVDEA